MTLPVDQVICGSALTVLAGFPADSIDCIVTSPPYWGLRDYGVEGQLGLESHPQQYLEKLWAIFDECKRVLKPTGCCFVNMGDTYFGGAPVEQPKDAKGVKRPTWGTPAEGQWLKPKNLLMIPERFAVGMVERGWWLRNKIVWSKPNAMPSSVKDRFSCTWESVFFFTKAARYAFDLDAVREPASTATEAEVNKASKWGHKKKLTNKPNVDDYAIEGQTHGYNPLGKNPGDCWRIPTCPFPEAHFATFPPDLIRKPIRAGCPAKVCVECGKPWERQVEVVRQINGQTTRHLQSGAGRHREAEPQERPPYSQGTIADSSDRRSRPLETVFAESIGQERKTVGWQPTCECGGLQAGDLEIINSPLGRDGQPDPSVTTGRAGYNRPRKDLEGTRPITRYEQRKYAEQLRDSPHCEEMQAEAGTAFDLYIRTDKSGARPILADLLDTWIERQWLHHVDSPMPESIPTEPGITYDPFVGSGTTCIVAKEEGRHYAGSDLSPEYCEMARKRLAQVQAPLDLH